MRVLDVVDAVDRLLARVELLPDVLGAQPEGSPRAHDRREATLVDAPFFGRPLTRVWSSGATPAPTYTLIWEEPG